LRENVDPRLRFLTELEPRTKERIMKVNLTIGIPCWLDKIFVWPLLLFRQLRYGYTYRQIYLGDGEWTIVEPADYYRLGNIKWCLGGHERKSYAIGGIRNNMGGVKIVYLHREIMTAPKGRIVDHKNGDSLDNRRANLRIATHAQNSSNKRKTRTKTTSRFIGVSYEKSQNRWAVKIKHKGKSHWIGGFKSEIEAAKARDSAAKKYHGEFARLNFPEENLLNNPQAGLRVNH
jgi:hypothetical protein